MESPMCDDTLYSKRSFRRSIDDEPASPTADEGTPRRSYNLAKRRQVLERQRSDGCPRLDIQASPSRHSMYEMHRISSSSFGVSPSLLDYEDYVGDMFDGMTPCLSTERALAEYRQLAQSQFRRIYYDLSRGIGVPDEGIGFLFKCGPNDISTSTYGMYGEIKPSCIQKVCNEMIRFGLDRHSVVLDLGSGRGVPSFLFAHQVPVFASVGIEICPVSYESSVHNLLHYLKLDVARCICERTGFGVRTAPFHDPVAYARSCLVGSCTGSTGEGTRTPHAKRPSGAPVASRDSPAAAGSLPGVGEQSLETHYDSDGAVYDDSCSTPVASSSGSVDDCVFYHALDSFSQLPSSLGVGFCNEDISAFDHFEGASHIYSFDIAMEKALVNNIVRQFLNTSTAWLFASFNGDLLDRFELRGCFLAAKVPCQMYKSGEHRCCYIYVKSDWERIKEEYDAAMCRVFHQLDPSPAASPAAPMASKSDKGSSSAHSEAADSPVQDVPFAGPDGCAASPALECHASPRMLGSAFSGGSRDVLLSQFNEPVEVFELIKLAKMPLEAQLGWYLKKVMRTGAMLTRSKRQNSITQLKRSLCTHRCKLLEMIASSTDPSSARKYVGMLQRHIQQKYMPVRSFPNPSTSI